MPAPQPPPPAGRPRPHGTCPTCLSSSPLLDFAIDGPGRCPDPWHDTNRPASAMRLTDRPSTGLDYDHMVLDDPIQEDCPPAGTPVAGPAGSLDNRAVRAILFDRDEGGAPVGNDRHRSTPPPPDYVAPFHSLSVRAVRAIPAAVMVWVRRTRDGRPHRHRRRRQQPQTPGQVLRDVLADADRSMGPGSWHLPDKDGHG